MKKLFFLTFCIFEYTFCFCQNLKVPLTDRMGNSSIVPTITTGVTVPEIKVYSGFDSTKYKEYSIKQLIFSGLQREIENVIDKYSIDMAKSWVKKYRDTTHAFYQKIPKNSAAYLYGVGKDGLIHFIMDANNNRRFDDDIPYVFDTANVKEKYYPIVNVNFEYYDGRALQMIKVPYKINAYTARLPKIYVNDILDETDVQFICPIYKQGLYKSKNGNFLFNVTTEHMSVYKNEPFKVTVQFFKNKTIIKEKPLVYKSNQLLEFNQGLYKIDSLSRDTLYLCFIERTIYEGARIGTMAPNIDGSDIINGTAFSLKSKRGKYNVINFWGSWCHPCIEEIPDLKSLHHKHNNVEFLSIAADLPEDMAKLKTLIAEKILPWTQLQVHRSVRDKGVLWDYKVSAFPTTILVDPDGKIVLRGEGADILTKIDKFLTEKKLK